MHRRLLLWLSLVLALTGACLKKTEKVSIAPAKKNAQVASRDQLRQLINDRYAAVQTITYSRLRVQVEGYYVKKEKKESYPRGSGYMVVKRPYWIRMNINNPLTSSTVAAMAANGSRFQVWVPSENKYLTGAVQVKIEGDNPFYNIRPQHVVEAVFVQPVLSVANRSFLVYEESDPRFSYYVIDDFENGAGSPRLLRRIWIERSQLRITRQQWYGANGQLVSDALYGSQAQVNGLPVFLDLNLNRAGDSYRLTFNFDREAIKVNEPVEEASFEVPVPPGAQVVEVKGKTED
jgi:hypothetical protein